jgi:hypothetical protein
MFVYKLELLLYAACVKRQKAILQQNLCLFQSAATSGAWPLPAGHWRGATHSKMPRQDVQCVLLSKHVSMLLLKKGKTATLQQM